MPVEHTPKGKGRQSPEEENEEQEVPSDDDQEENSESEQEEDENEEDDDPLSLLIYKRGQVKAKVTRIRNTLRNERERMNLPRVQVMQRSLLTFYDEYTRYHNEVLDNVNKKGRKSQETKYEEFEKLYTNTLVAIQSLEHDFSAPSPSLLPSTSHAGAERVVIHQQSLKAPLPTFDGQYENWPKFKSMFLDLMKNSHDSDALKLYHLEKSLVGSAAGVIDIKTINDNNYNRAWKILEDRFENKRNIIDTHIRGLSKLKKMTKESHVELRELIEECTRHVDHLEFMQQNLEGVSELMVVNHLSDALDNETKKLWEATLDYGELPTYKATIDFLKKRCQILERCESPATLSHQKTKPMAKTAPVKTFTKSHATMSQPSNDVFECHLCNKSHPTFRCDEFRALSIDDRNKRVKELNACFNCLRKGHRLAECKSKRNCMVCRARHNTLLHYDSSSSHNPGSKEKVGHHKVEGAPSGKNCVSQQKNNVPTPSASNESSESICSYSIPQAPSQVLLMTAEVNVYDKNRKLIPCRAFIDPGSMSHMVSKRFAKLLDIPTDPAFVTVSGINGTKSTADKRLTIEFESRTQDFRAIINCLVLDKVTGSLPLTSIDVSSWGIPSGFELADPQFHVTSEVDLLIGCGLFWQMLIPGTLKVGDNLPELHNSKLGWIVTGEYSVNDEAAEAVVVHSNAAIVSSLEALIQKFWEIEEVPEESCDTSEKELCEQHFQKTHRRDESGRYVVSLPFKETVNELGDSRAVAIKRFLMLEKRLNRSPDLKSQYVSFMEEYQSLKHCKEVDESKDPPGLQTYYLPHHAVLRPSSSSTKLRVVFDGSSKSSSGKSLNDVLQVGAVVQEDLFSIALKFRKHIIAFTADLTKMYRQVCVNQEDTRYQRVFWRKCSSDPLKVYELTTITYGTASAPFLATRALKQLAMDEAEDYPEAAEVVQNDFYVDDVLSGADTVEEAILRQSQLKELLARGGFPIHKWSSNSQEVVQSVPVEEREKLVEIQSANEVIKTLGLLWDPVADEFMFVVPEVDQVDETKITKRYILSQIAKLFDPYGFLAPIGVVAKLLMQRLWASNLDWDDQLPDNLSTAWFAYRDALPSISAMRISRCVVPQSVVSVELHGFSDASNLAYGACIYFRCIHSDGSISTKLLCSKSKVAPLKELTIPRKELCAALLLCRLLKKVVPVLKLQFNDVVLYSDSQIVLAWFKKAQTVLQIFVRNRVKEINEITQEFNAVWNYVYTLDNPADIVSRGQLAEALRVNTLWWYGPPFLRAKEYMQSPLKQLADTEIPELRKVVCAASAIEEVLPVFTRYSSFRKLQRVVGLVLRFINNARQKDPERRYKAQTVSVPETRAALQVIIRVVQHSEFSDEIERVQHGEPCKRFGNLSPIYQNQLLRVGGRLQESDLPYDAKHQLILPNNNPIVKLMIRAIHIENLHVGPLGLVAAIRQRFWVLNAKSSARQITWSCIQCFKANPRGIDQQMGNLPKSRVTQSFPFARTGVDFAGPVYVKHGGRKTTLVKAYIAVFVCMAVKAVHLELVSDLSAPAFIAALQRFVSRRGVPEQIHSDNGLNFVGANNELHELFTLFKDQQLQGLLDNFCQPKEIEWKFIPPRAPNFGGIWEANVKCVKSHLKRVLQTTSLDYQEFSTLLIQIEAVLNSRPLFAPSSDPNDLAAITPGHFLIGRELTAIPEPSYDNEKVGRLSRWQYIQLLRQHFWKRWSSEYLHHLQVRGKWQNKKQNVSKGMIVILKEDNQPAQSWRLGRIQNTYPGKDGSVRVVDIRTSQGVFKRSIGRVCPLPIVENRIEISDASSDPNPAA